MGKFRDKFKIRSSESIDRIDFDLNVGVVRVSGGVLRNFSRNEFVRIINHTAEGKPKIIRIIRARTGQGALSDNEIALQYDDRVKLNIRNAGDHVDLTLHTIPLIVAIWPFCASHSSPLIVAQFWLSVALALIGVLAGVLLASLAFVGC